MDYQKKQDRQQSEIFCLEQQISSDSFARIVDAFVDSIELKRFNFKHSRLKQEGRPPYDPADLLKLYLYGYRHGIRSSRKLAQACINNIEVWWLIGRLQPSYKTIAEFRRQNKPCFRQVFRCLTLFLQGWELVEAQTIAIDSVKIRAQNSRKNNYNPTKIQRHLDYIDQQIDRVLDDFETADTKEDQQATQSDFESLMVRRFAYEQLDHQLKQCQNTQISTTDPEARMMPIRRKITEVCYSSQTAVDAANNLIVNYEISNQRDTHALSAIAKDTKMLLQVDYMDVLADKGYHTGSELQACEAENITPFVAPKSTSPKHKTHRIGKSDFRYDHQQDQYICPAEQSLTSNGNWYVKNIGSGRQAYRIKRYTISYRVCNSCPLRDQCVGPGTLGQRQGRAIERSEYESAITANAQRVSLHKTYYQIRQSIVEHPFGTLKRQWGITYTLVKGLEKVDAEIGIAYTAYNLLRCSTILGPLELIQRLKQVILWMLSLWRSMEQEVDLKIKIKPVSVYSHVKHLGQCG